MIFTGSLSAVTFADVEEFCKKWSEGIRVEFGGTSTKDVAKAVAAFSNTMGGVLLLGVTEDKHGKAIFPIAGMPLEPGLEDAIMQSCVTGVYPSVVPEIKIVPLEADASKCVAIVRIEESTFAPHAIQSKTRVYIRTGSQSNPVDYADMDRIEFMLHRREKSESLRADLLNRARKRLSRLLNLKVGVPLLELSLSPSYPHAPLVSPESLIKWNFVDTKTSGGLYKITRNEQDGSRGTYTELDQYGHFFRGYLENGKMPVGTKVFEGPSLKHIIIRTREFLETSELLYNDFQYRGSLKFVIRMLIPNPLIWRLIPVREPLFTEIEELKNIDGEVIHEMTLSVGNLEKEERRKIAENATAHVAWAFNCPIPLFEENFQLCYGRH